MSNDDLNSGMRQIVSDIAGDPSRPRQSRNDWYLDDSNQPITKRDAREIIEAIKDINHGTETNELLAETNKRLTEIKADLDWIKWSLCILGFIALFILYRMER